MSNKLQCEDLLPIIISDFGKVFRCRLRGETLEIQTPFQTQSGKLASVFISVRAGQYIISDGGWLEARDNPYEIISERDDEPPTNLHQHSLDVFKVKKFVSPAGDTYYFKSCSDIELISACINDVAHFVLHFCSASENAYFLQAETKQAGEQIMRFTRKANDFLKMHKSADAALEFRKKLPNLKGASFSASISRSSNMTFIMYVTGASFRYFQGEVTRSIACYEVLANSEWNSVVRDKLVLLDDEAPGYRPNDISAFIDLLSEKVTHVPIKWSQREMIQPFLA